LLVATRSDPNGKEQVKDTESGSNVLESSKHEKTSREVQFYDVLVTEMFI
jgi:hypothetical protein